MKRINVATALNSKYMRYTYVMLTSLFENQPNDIDIHVYLLHSDLTENDRHMLGEVVSSYGGSLHWLSVDRELFSSQCPTTDTWPLEAYYRLMLTDILPEDVERLLYLDVDIIVNKSLEELFFTDLGGKIVGACMDCNKQPFGDYRDVIFKEQIIQGFTYFCSGVLLLDIKSMRKRYHFADYMKLAEEMNFKMIAPDQDLLNYMHWKEVQILDGNKYNLFAKVAYNHDIHYAEVIQAVTIIHFIGQKPWHGKFIHYDIEKLWWDYAKTTPFYVEFMEEFIQSAVDSSLIYDTMLQLSTEKKQLKEELDKSLTLCQKLLQIVQEQQ